MTDFTTPEISVVIPVCNEEDNVIPLAREIAAARDPRVEFVRRFSLEASDTLVSGADVVSGTRAKAEPHFLVKLRQTYVDVIPPQ